MFLEEIGVLRYIHDFTFRNEALIQGCGWASGLCLLAEAEIKMEYLLYIVLTAKER